MEFIIQCDHALGKYPDALLRDESDRGYLGYCTRTLRVDGKDISLISDGAGLCGPVDNIRGGQIEPCSVKDALEWFSTSADFMANWEGDASDLCGIAAKEIERLEKA